MPGSRARILTVVFVIALITASCGGAGDEDSNDTGNESADAGTAATAAEPEADDLAGSTGETPSGQEAASATTAAQAAAPPEGLSTGIAVISLENGEVFEFSIMCALEPQPNFEYSIASYDDPANLDISKWSEDSQFSGTSVSIYDSTSYDTLWEANTTFNQQGGELELSLSGSTVSGSGLFWPGGDSFQEGVRGDILANC